MKANNYCCIHDIFKKYPNNLDLYTNPNTAQNPERISFPKPSPDNKQIVMMYHTGYSDTNTAVILDLNVPDKLHEVASRAWTNRWLTVTDAEGNPSVLLATTVLKNEIPDEDNLTQIGTIDYADTDANNISGIDSDAYPDDMQTLQRIVLTDPAKLLPIATIGGYIGREATRVAGSMENKVYFSSNNKGNNCLIGVYNLEDSTHQWIQTEKCLEDATLVEDGRIIAIASSTGKVESLAADTELYSMNVATTKLTRLTIDNIAERNIAAVRGGTILFEKAPSPFNRRFPLVSTCMASYSATTKIPQ